MQFIPRFSAIIQIFSGCKTAESRGLNRKCERGISVAFGPENRASVVTKQHFQLHKFDFFTTAQICLELQILLGRAAYQKSL